MGRAPLSSLALWLLLVLTGVAASPWAHAAGVQTLDTGVVDIRLARGGTEQALPVRLPLHWDVLRPRQAGWAVLRLRFQSDMPAGAESMALMIGRIGNAYRVRLNGAVVGAAGRIDRINDGWSNKRPVLILLPVAQLRADNELEIVIRADSSRRAGIGVVQVGPEHTMRVAWDAQEWRRVTLPRAVSLLSAMIAAFALMLWLQQRERLYLLAAGCVLLWSLRIATLTWESDRFDWHLWFRITLLIFWLGCLITYLLVRSVWERRPRVESRLAWALFAAGPMVAASGWWLPPLVAANAVTAWMVALVTAWLALALHLGWTLWRAGVRPDSARLWMLAMLLIGWASLVRDVLLARILGAGYEALGWTVLAAMFVDIAVLCIAGTRFQQARRQVDRFQQSLQSRLAERERELAVQHARLQSLEVERSVAAERQRILRDMHDGAGAHLVTAMRQIEGGQASRAQVMQTLRDSLDQLRLSIDALNLPLGDVNALLASLRFRMQGRIEDAGLQLEWSVPMLPPWAGATEAAMRHLQYILLEAISNVLQHARATTLVVHAEAEPTAIALRLEDDGCGLGEGRGNGLASMAQRARQAGVDLAVAPRRPGPGTLVRLRLPAAASGPAAAPGAAASPATERVTASAAPRPRA